MGNNLIFALVVACCLWVNGAAADDAYRLGPKDVVRVTVYEQPDLSTVAPIAENGTIGFALVGEIPLAGLTEREAELRIASLLEENDIVRSPQVRVIVDSYQSQRVSVLGQVARPGVYPITRDSTVLDLIAEAGGLVETAGEVAIVTNSTGGAESRKVVDLSALLDNGPGSDAVVMTDGDRVYVPRMDRFYIYGQVNQPGAYRLDRGMTVMQALAVAGGLTNRGTERGMTIRRQAEAGEAVIRVELTDKVLASDVIHIKESLF